MSPVKPPPSPNLATLLDRLFLQLRAVINRDDVDDLRTSHYRVLNAVGDGATITQIAATVGVTKQGVGQMVTHLVSTGHLIEVADPADRRRRVVVRTRRGAEATAATDARIEALEQLWAKQVGPGRYAEFRQLLTALTTTAEAKL